MTDYYIVIFDLNNYGSVLKHFSDVKECIKYYRKYCTETSSVHYVILESVDISKYFLSYD